MAQSLALPFFVLCVLGQLVAGSSQSQLHEQQDLGDSEALVQTLTHIQIDENKPKSLQEAFAEVDQKVKALQKRQLANLTSKLKSKFQMVLEKSKTVKELAERELAAAAEEQAQAEAAAAAAPPPPAVAEELHAEQEVEEVPEKKAAPAPTAEELLEAKKAKFGEAITLVIRNPLDGDVNVTFRASTRFNALFKSVCKRVGVKRADTHFMHKGEELTDDQTPESIGLNSGSVIELFAKPLQFRKEAKDREALEFARNAQLEAAKEEKVEVHEVTMSAKRKKEMDDIHKAAEKNKVQRLKEQRRRKENLVSLKFIDPMGDEVNMMVKRDKVLQPIFSLACKRLGINEEHAAFYSGPDHKRISSHGTVQSLGLRHNSIIEVRKPFK